MTSAPKGRQNILSFQMRRQKRITGRTECLSMFGSRNIITNNWAKQHYPHNTCLSMRSCLFLFGLTLLSSQQRAEVVQDEMKVSQLSVSELIWLRLRVLYTKINLIHLKTISVPYRKNAFTAFFFLYWSKNDRNPEGGIIYEVNGFIDSNVTFLYYFQAACNNNF